MAYADLRAALDVAMTTAHHARSRIQNGSWGAGGGWANPPGGPYINTGENGGYPKNNGYPTGRNLRIVWLWVTPMYDAWCTANNVRVQIAHCNMFGKHGSTSAAWQKESYVTCANGGGQMDNYAVNVAEDHSPFVRNEAEGQSCDARYIGRSSSPGDRMWQPFPTGLVAVDNSDLYGHFIGMLCRLIPNDPNQAFDYQNANLMAYIGVDDYGTAGPGPIYGGNYYKSEFYHSRLTLLTPEWQWIAGFCFRDGSGDMSAASARTLILSDLPPVEGMSDPGGGGGSGGGGSGGGGSGGGTVDGAWPTRPLAQLLTTSGDITAGLLYAQAVDTQPTITTTSLATGTVGTSYSQTVTGTNVTTWGASGLPPGLAINSGTGAITGTPTVDGVYSVRLSAVNEGVEATKTLSLRVDPAAVVSQISGAWGSIIRKS